jgi:hypothetical protein
MYALMERLEELRKADDTLDAEPIDDDPWDPLTEKQ